ncbi:thiamine pyrophosphate enzyme [Capsaspora owczarzaki ATCC 30864]|uniref:Thiamine pyrophosphate enzyme n=1 Tax=Capsaspora owczarzaki (strain ATCC 30864) TaxID=595528 RepID=A0A0D2VS41_CAPO3|nr:thiamine pyrophosphate enzyme [Capsaspora owczarzaki ATCC 30864]KJE93847.1 thiamine pyrophosphate enzyme [Capsaspora owczarzaki ATCC 30864]|eukprot:XP_004347321.1 thiamine pyrophosphate enzyme [Capsaspora owczarzaki ATCC 30864]
MLTSTTARLLLASRAASASVASAASAAMVGAGRRSVTTAAVAAATTSSSALTAQTAQSGRGSAPLLPAATSSRGVQTSAKTSMSAVEPNAEEEKEKQPFTELVRDFLDPGDFYKQVNKIGVDFFTGVPDSLLKDFCAYVTANTPSDHHVITANEGNAVALAAGHHLATGKSGLVYLQNSGLGNIVNPLMSLAVPEVYSIPMLLLIGWRGEPGKKDEPQHLVQGQATPGLLASLNIPFQVLPDFQEGAAKVLETARQYMEQNHGPYAILVRRQTFLPYKLKSDKGSFPLNREGALKLIVDTLSARDIVVGTTGMLSRELFEYRVAKKHGHEKDFLTVGSMGHASAIALGIALARPVRQVYCLDGDGALLMHMGTMATIGHSGVKNLKHIVINNGAHDSVGGQPTCALNGSLSITGVAQSSGYRFVETASEIDDIRAKLKLLHEAQGPALLEICVNRGGRKDLGRPTRSPVQNKHDFMDFVQSEY